MFRKIIITLILALLSISYCFSEPIKINSINNTQQPLTEHEVIVHVFRFVGNEKFLVARYMRSQGRCPDNVYTADRFIAKAIFFSTQYIERINIQEVNGKCKLTAVIRDDINMNNIAGKTIAVTILDALDDGMVIVRYDSDIETKYWPESYRSFFSENEAVATNKTRQPVIDRRTPAEKRQSEIKFVVGYALGSLFVEETEIIEYYYDHNVECPDYNFVGPYYKTYVAAMNRRKVNGKCVITATIKDPVIVAPNGKEVYVLHEIAGKKVSLTLTATKEGRYFWSCSGNVDKEYFPESCLSHRSQVD